MNRNEKILRHIKKDGLGIEIGPSHNPIAPKKQGFNVDIIDYMSRDELIQRYANHPVNIDNIEEVDFVWQGESYAKLTGKSKHYDWIISSHSIEHTPDLIGFLNDCDAILKEDGVLSLAIPDKRYCFDHYRPITGLSKVIDNHFKKSTIHSPGNVAEFFLNMVSNNGTTAWNEDINGSYKFIHSKEQAVKFMNSVVNENAYYDVHAWCFVPHSFRLMIHDLFSLDLIALQEVDFYPTYGCEFYITLGKKGKGSDRSRIEMLEMIETEINIDREKPLKSELVQVKLEKQQTEANLQAELARSRADQESLKTEFASKLEETEAQWQSKVAEKNAELEQVRNQLQTQLEQTQNELGQTQNQLGQTQNELGQTQNQLGQTQNQLGQTQNQLGQTQAELASSQNQLQQSQEMIQAMETSKFWKLRTQWFKIKKAFGLAID